MNRKRFFFDNPEKCFVLLEKDNQALVWVSTKVVITSASLRMAMNRSPTYRHPSTHASILEFYPGMKRVGKSVGSFSHRFNFITTRADSVIYKLNQFSLTVSC